MAGSGVGEPGAAVDGGMGVADGGLSTGGVAGSGAAGAALLGGFTEVSPGRLGVAGAVALVLAALPVSAPAVGMGEALACWPDHQSFDALAFGEAFR